MKHEVWTEEEVQYLHELKQKGHTHREIASIMSEKYKMEFTFHAVRHKAVRTKQEEELPGYKEEYKIEPDGSHKSDKLLRMSAEQKKDVKFLLEAHGFNIDSWELITAKNNIWNTYSKQDGINTLYASKITVKPKVSSFNIDNLLKKIEQVPPKYIEPKYTRDIDYLNIPLFDMHFPISDYEYYKPTQQTILGLLQKGYKEVLIIIGQDLLHNDDFRGRTSSGREIEKVDMELAWDEALKFYVPIIEMAIEKCKKVNICYSKGNHDESMSWAFVKCLEVRFPQVNVDTRFKERKVHMLGTNFIGINHGDKKKDTNLNENFSTEFPMEWSRATTREIFTGHLHHERVLDKGGAVVRRMPTGNRVDDYHDDHGYTTAHKRFEVFEYSEDKLKTIHYV
ncbi:hypothetical protein KYJ26_20240 [Bacillus sp. MCCB 382]|uniref:hypothetical protein n=1 Tax=Bacillus sp. MCCB 382 TaxID=2860197 RepID=UPI001C57D066|nr:hypothetical protein [Bacillus sp. MCCB 382]